MPSKTELNGALGLVAQKKTFKVPIENIAKIDKKKINKCFNTHTVSDPNLG